MPMHNWLDRYPLLHPDHAHDLERDAALNEFEHGMDRDKAEENAYDNYKRKQSAQAAAWHLTGMRSSAGKESQKHALMYASHIRSMGYDPSGPVPSEVKAHMDSENFKHPVKFKAHGADGLLFNKVNKSEEPLENRFASIKKSAQIAIALEVIKRLNTLKKTAKSAILLEKLLKGNPMGMIPAFKHLPSGNVVKSPGFHDVDVLPGGEFTPEWEDGYVDETGKFYNRHDAAKALGTTHDTVDSFEIDPANPGYVQKSEEESSEASEPEKKLELQLPKKDRDIIASIREKLDKLFEPNEEIGPTPATVEAFKKLMGEEDEED